MITFRVKSTIRFGSPESCFSTFRCTTDSLAREPFPACFGVLGEEREVSMGDLIAGTKTL